MSKKSLPTGAVQISSAVIRGLYEKPYYSDEKLAYFWDITFEEHIANFGNIAMIYMGKTKEEAYKYHEVLLNRFDAVGIKSGERILVINNSGEVFAIAAENGLLCVDVTDKFYVKSYGKLMSDLIRESYV